MTNVADSGLSPEAGRDVLVRVVPVDRDGRQISRRDEIAETLADRLDDVRRGIAAGTAAIQSGLADVAVPDGWTVGDVTVTFGITLAAEGSVIITKASTEASFEVAISYSRSAAVGR